MKRFCLLNSLVEYDQFSSMFPVPLIKYLTSHSSQTPGYIPFTFSPSKYRQGSPGVCGFLGAIWSAHVETTLYRLDTHFLYTDIKYINSEQQQFIEHLLGANHFAQILNILRLIFLMYKLEIDSNLQCYEIKISKECKVFFHNEIMIRNKKAGIQFRMSDSRYRADNHHTILPCSSI